MEHHEWLKNPLEKQLFDVIWILQTCWSLGVFDAPKNGPPTFICAQLKLVICLWGGNDDNHRHASKKKHQPNDRPSNEMIKMRHPLRTPEPPGRVSSQIPHTWCALSRLLKNPWKWVKWISPKKQLKYLAVITYSLATCNESLERQDYLSLRPHQFSGLSWKTNHPSLQHTFFDMAKKNISIISVTVFFRWFGGGSFIWKNVG